jgi:putative CocE/NonD family hydrolase
MTQQRNALVRQLNVRVPMRDGVKLSAEIYRPDTREPVPVVLIRTPYTRAKGPSAPDYPEQGQWWASQGYAFVVQDVRGRGDSDGIFYPLVNEAVDGFDTLEWVGR